MGNFQRPYFLKYFFPLMLAVCFLIIAVHSVTAQSNPGTPRPKVILISLDGAQPDIINQYLEQGVLSPNQGLGLLKSLGIVAKQNITCNPSLTAACHTSIGSGSNTSRTDVVANTFHLDASPFITTVSGFNAPIGGYSLNKEGYNFDGIQSPPVARLGDDSTTSQFLSVSNLYGAHGYNPITQEMSASFFAAGPDIRKGKLDQIRNIDVAPTIDQLLGVKPASTVQGTALNINLKTSWRQAARNAQVQLQSLAKVQ